MALRGALLLLKKPVGWFHGGAPWGATRAHGKKVIPVTLPVGSVVASGSSVVVNYSATTLMSTGAAGWSVIINGVLGTVIVASAPNNDVNLTITETILSGDSVQVSLDAAQSDLTVGGAEGASFNLLQATNGL